MNANRCFTCGKLIKYKNARARRRVYCDDACKQTAYRMRREGTASVEVVTAFIKTFQDKWEQLGYPSMLIEQLMDFRKKYGDVALADLEILMAEFYRWTIESWTRQTNEVAPAVQAAQALIEARREEEQAKSS